MTGLEISGSYLYLSSVNQNACYRYSMPGVSGRTIYRTYVGYSQTKDIAINSENHIWVAANHATHTLRLYNASNQMIDFIEPSLVPYATGVTMDPEGYLWVADPVNDKIYKIELLTSIEGEETAGIPGFSIRAGANPFVGAVTLFIEGMSTAEVEILDISGRTVASGTARGAFIWDGTCQGVPAPSGGYIALVRGESGNVRTLSLIKL